MGRPYEAKPKIALEVSLVLTWQVLRSFLLLFYIHGASCVTPSFPCCIFLLYVGIFCWENQENRKGQGGVIDLSSDSRIEFLCLCPI